jgi:DNA-binding FrmR family transcriptional regulator
LARLKRIEGQVGGSRRIVEEDKYCVDILLQISAAQGALGQVGKTLLNSHMNTCVSDAFERGSKSELSNKIAELLDVLSRFGHLGARGA